MAISLLRLEMFLFLGALSLIVLMKLLSGRINVTGLLWQANPKTGQQEFSPARVQLLMATLISAGQYLLQVIAHPHALPDIPNQIILMQGASGGTYLLAKLRAVARNYFN